MDDKKINLLPENLRSRDDKSKRPALNFNPDFKKPGKKEKSLNYKPSGSNVSWWDRTFKKSKKIKDNQPAPHIAAPSISYNNEDQKIAPSKIEPITMRATSAPAVKIEEHIQDFVPAQAKIAKPKKPSFWSRFAKKPKVKTQAPASSALANGLKYNGHSQAPKATPVAPSEAWSQPQGKVDVKVFQDFSKQTEESKNLSAKLPPISNQVYATAQAPAEAPAQTAPKPTPEIEFVPAKKIKKQGPSWWSKFLALFKHQAKTQSIASEPVKDLDSLAKDIKVDADILSDLNKQKEETNNFNLSVPKMDSMPNKNTQDFSQKPSNSFDLTQKIAEEIDLAPLKPMDAEPTQAPAPAPAPSNGFSMPEYAPKAEVKVDEMPSNNPVNKGPKVTGPKFHIPEPAEKNSLLNGRVDLIPVAARVRSWQQILTLFGFAILLSVFILGAIYVYVMYEEQRIVAEQNKQKEEIAKIEEKILDFTQLNKDINALGQEIRLVQDTLNKHIYWTNFFELLEKYTVSDVYYSGLAVGTNGGLTLSASTKSYDSVAKQLKVLSTEKAKEFASDVSITGAKRDEEGTVTFQVILSLNESLFYYRSEP